MKSSATIEAYTLDWHLARCAEGTCDREWVRGEKQIKILEQCVRDTCPAGISNIEHEVLMHVLGDTCPRKKARL